MSEGQPFIIDELLEFLENDENWSDIEVGSDSEEEEEGEHLMNGFDPENVYLNNIDERESDSDEHEHAPDLDPEALEDGLENESSDNENEEQEYESDDHQHVDDGNDDGEDPEVLLNGVEYQSSGNENEESDQEVELPVPN
ncbi:hypothetical protein ABEB36_006168 [Hypothenemus hampei]|uniref:Uncharacterized protein n=1 Tax=Hypothenemus hampei TaxID=57062 RepID=A0ABD1ETK5_HYPHA